MSVSIREKIEESFKQDTPERDYAKEYLAEVRTNWRENENSTTRTTALIAAIAAIFELLLTNEAKGATFLTIQLSNSEVLRFALPVAVAYLYYTLGLGLLDTVIFRATHDAIVRTVYPTIVKHNGEGPLYPSNSVIWGHNRLQDLAGKIGLGRVFIARSFIITTGAPIFIIIAYVQLFMKYGINNFLLWLSLIMGGILVTLGGMSVFGGAFINQGD